MRGGVLFSCQKSDFVSEKKSTISSDEQKAQTANILFSDVAYQGESAATDLLTLFYNSPQWATVPQNIKNQLNNAKEILADSTNLRVLQFEIGILTDQKKSTLVAWFYNGKFITFINTFTLLPNGNYFFNRTNFNNKSYLNFQINSNNKIGLFNQKPIVNMPLFVRNGSQVTPTCMESTTTWSDCMSCAYHECTDDWVCGLACGLVSPVGCGSVWAISCAVQ